jgi:hypothetical protein
MWISLARWNELIARLYSIENRLYWLQRKELQVAKSLDDLSADVTASKSVNDSVVTLLSGLATQIAALKSTQTDPATAQKIDALASQIEQQNADLAAAVTANTPAQ